MDDMHDFHVIEVAQRERNTSSSQSHYSSRKDLLYIAGNSDLCQDSLNPTNHEFSHFLLHVGTPYGLLVDSINWSEQRILLLCLKHFERHRVPLPTPFYEFANSVFNGKRNFFSSAAKRFAEAAVREYIQPWSMLLHTENVLEGRKLESVTRETAVSAFKFLAKTEKIVGREMLYTTEDAEPHPSQLLVERYNGDLPACPEVQLWGHGRDRIGAQHIFEAMAVTAERDHYAITSIGTQPEYGFLVFSHFHLPAMAEYDQNGPMLRPDGGIKFRKDISEERFTLFARAFAAICDLALFSPLGALYAPLRKKFQHQSFCWMQVHPGWRVLQGMQEIRTLALAMDNFASGIKKLQLFLCKKYQWIEPENFYEAASSFTIEDGTPECIKRHVAFMALREAHPLLLYKYHLQEDLSEHEQLAMQTFFNLHRPWMYLPGFGYVIGDGDDLMNRIVPYFLANATDQIMFRKKFDARSCVPSDIHYSKYYANMGNAADFAELLRSSLCGGVKY